MGAICAIGISASAEMTPADTLDRYVINGLKVENFDSSQLTGKTVSDYKVVVLQGKSGTEAVRMHLIRTDGKKLNSTISSGTAKGDAGVADGSSTIYVIDGKKSDRDALSKLGSDSIASMTVYRPGSKVAVKYSGRNNVPVVMVETKK